MHMLLNACKDIGLTMYTGSTKYMEVGSHLGVMVNEHITVVSNTYRNEKTFKY